MQSLEKRWQVAPRISPEAAQNLSKYSPTFQQILYNRGIATQEEAQEFLAAEHTEYDPYDLSGMVAAVERIGQALSRQEHIVVYGDYDADGVTASALMVQTLQALQARVSCYIPNRFEEGYGLNPEALTKLKEEGADLVITVDCGIRAIPQAEHAREIGLDLVITDHHTPGETLPQVAALINPKQKGDRYPEKNLAGVGTAYKLACTLIDRFDPPGITPGHLIDLVAIGTVADMVPLVGENRSLVRRGLAALRRPHRQGLHSLMEVAGIKAERVTAMDLGFAIGPRINAAGRLADAMDAFNLLMTSDVHKAGQLVQALDNRNRERQNITREIEKLSEEQAVEKDPHPYLLFSADPSFNPGVVGLAASRLADKYYRPAVVAHQGDEFTRASCRSIPEFHITHALEECADLLTHFGGHAAAAGFTVSNHNLSELVARLTSDAKKQLAGQDLRPLLQIDAEVELDDLNFGLLAELDHLQPTGYGNASPLFASREVRTVNYRTVGQENAHLKLTVVQGQYTFDAIAFKLGHWAEAMPPKIDLAYSFEINEFNGKKSLQLNIQDIKASG